MAPHHDEVSVKLPKLFAPEWIFRYLAIALLIANLYLNAHFINKEEYSADKQEWSSALKRLSDSVSDLKFALAAHSDLRSAVTDHESRIRVLEKVSHPPNH